MARGHYADVGNGWKQKQKGHPHANAPDRSPAAWGPKWKCERCGFGDNWSHRTQCIKCQHPRFRQGGASEHSKAYKELQKKHAATERELDELRNKDEPVDPKDTESKEDLKKELQGLHETKKNTQDKTFAEHVDRRIEDIKRQLGMVEGVRPHVQVAHRHSKGKKEVDKCESKLEKAQMAACKAAELVLEAQAQLAAAKVQFAILEEEFTRSAEKVVSAVEPAHGYDFDEEDFQIYPELRKTVADLELVYAQKRERKKVAKSQAEAAAAAASAKVEAEQTQQAPAVAPAAAAPEPPQPVGAAEDSNAGKADVPMADSPSEAEIAEVLGKHLDGVYTTSKPVELSEVSEADLPEARRKLAYEHALGMAKQSTAKRQKTDPQCL